MRLTRDEAEFYRAIVDEYRQATGTREFDVNDAVAWAIQCKRLEMSNPIAVAYYAPRVSEALRQDFITTGQGTRVRRRHCVRHCFRDPESGEMVQRTLWNNLDEASDQFLLRSVRQRLSGIARDVRAIEDEVAYYRTARPALGQILTQLLMNFDPRTYEGDEPEIGEEPLPE